MSPSALLSQQSAVLVGAVETTPELFLYFSVWPLCNVLGEKAEQKSIRKPHVFMRCGWTV